MRKRRRKGEANAESSTGTARGEADEIGEVEMAEE